ncbi:hypothetical protein ATANTOWER_007303 [Ataeniobius toweri]|uniref:Uncharacterized protein n=1 Tax=Ataeniobius toweri TaxID=208326 RepID=A0ABU7AZ03_9TELE|nr:hypothetical protein [Ataeniobius toweri]
MTYTNKVPRQPKNKLAGCLARRQRILLGRDCPISRLLHRGQPGQPHRLRQNATIRAGIIRKFLPEMLIAKAGGAHVMTVLRLCSRTGRTTEIVHHRSWKTGKQAATEELNELKMPSRLRRLTPSLVLLEVSSC